MISENFTFIGEEQVRVYAYRWLPDPEISVKGIVQIAHGMAEGAHRYERVANYLTDRGYIVYAHDHRGHGRTAKDLDDIGILAEKEGFKCLVKDLYSLTQLIKKENAQLPLFLLSHSMGSFVAQAYIMRYGKELDGVILSGTNGKQGFILDIGLWVAKQQVKKKGRNAKSPEMDKLIFGTYNKQFKPNRTSFDWLSRDEKEVDKYIEDPYCGSVFTAGFFEDFLTGLKYVGSLENKKTIPLDLPIYIFAGDKDPVGRNGKGIYDLVKDYEKVGIKNVTYKLYPEGRHEMFNEINRKEVMEDVVKWLDSLIER